ALPHRLETTPFDDAPDPEDVIEDHFEDGVSDDTEGESSDGETGESAESDGVGDERGGDADQRGGDGRGEDADGRDSSADSGDDAEGGEDHDSAADREDPDGSTEGDDRGDRPDRDGPAGHRSSEAGGADTDSGGVDPEQTTASGDGDGSDEADDDRGDGTGSEESTDESDATPLLPGQSRETSPESVSTRSPEFDTPEAERAGSGDHAASSPDPEGHGATVRTERASTDDSVDAAASVRAAAARGSEEVTSQDLRQSVRTGGGSALVVFALDASASMRGPMETAKGVALDLLQDAYERRDEVAVVTFAGESADVVLPPTDSVDLAARHLKSLPTGDRTPLPAGIDASAAVIDRADPEAAVVVIVTDGRANAGTSSPTADTRSAARRLAERDTDTEVLVVDAGTDQRTSLVGDIVTGADGRRVPLAELTPDRVAGAVQRATADGATVGGNPADGGSSGESGGGV
ncbi:MAG: VWA domain-containing protein, partial [Halobaculum sp.]